MTTRLVTFLGTGEYKETTYCWQQEVRTRFVAQAIAEIAQVAEVVVLTTKEAWQKYGDEFEHGLKKYGLSTPEKFLPLGSTTAELWEQFELVKTALRPCPGTKVLLDITHGFRSSPFFAAAAVAFTRLIDPDLPEMQVVYGAFEARDKEKNITPIWEVTPFIDLLDWSRNLMLFLRTGRAAELSGAMDTLGRALQKSWYVAGKQGTQPGVRSLGNALRRFGEDIETLRTGSLLLGSDSNNRSSVYQLLRELEHSAQELPQHIPPVADVLDRIRATVEGLRTAERLSQPDGQRALKALASYYLQMGRYPEAAATIREAWINQHACSKSDCPGMPEFSDEHRKAAENAWYAANENIAREIAETRNDIQHAGYRSQPLPAETIKRKIKDLIDKLDPKHFMPDTVYYSIGVDAPITPDEPLPPLPAIPRGALVVIEGRAPIWRYGLAFHRLHGSPAAAVAVYDPRLGAVVVASHSPRFADGQVIDVSPPPDDQPTSGRH